MDKFELNILGRGSATTSMRHMPTNQVLNIRDNLFMIDCGGKDNGKNRSYSKKSEKKVVTLQPCGTDIPSNQQRKQKISNE